MATQLQSRTKLKLNNFNQSTNCLAIQFTFIWQRRDMFFTYGLFVAYFYRQGFFGLNFNHPTIRIQFLLEWYTDIPSFFCFVQFSTMFISLVPLGILFCDSHHIRLVDIGGTQWQNRGVESV